MEAIALTWLNRSGRPTSSATPALWPDSGLRGRNCARAVCIITETGQRVLQGQADFVELNGIDLWLGGVHLRADNLWRWDNQQILARAAV
jgi:hypothetical protein